MLVIARKVGQTVLIGDEIEVTISAIRGDQVRLAIKAPRSVTILREEVLRQGEPGATASDSPGEPEVGRGTGLEASPAASTGSPVRAAEEDNPE